MKTTTHSLFASLAIALILTACLCTAAGRASGQVLPETPAGHRMEEILNLISEGDAEAAKQYVMEAYTPEFRDAFPAAQHAGVFRQIRTGFPGLKPVSVIESSSDLLKILLKSETSGRWLEMHVKVEAESPHRIASLGIELAKAPEGQGGSSARPPEISNLDDLDAYLSGLEEDNAFSGVVLVAKGGASVLQKAYGLADKGHRVPNTIDTKFNLGSINKIFTSVAAARLMQEGRLGLDDPIGKYLDGLPEDAATKVTIRHLLQMSSGWGDYWANETYLATRFDLRLVADYMEFLKDMPLAFEPGSQTTHSNTGFEVLGAVIEKITGLDYFDYVRDTIYAPADMTHSDSYERDAVVENLATGYTNMHPYDDVGEGFVRTNTLMLSPRGTPAGGGYSTAGDMLRFATALTGHRLLEPGYTSLLFNSFNEIEEGGQARSAMTVAGGAPGVSAFLSMNLEDDYTVVVLSNYDSPVAVEVGRAIKGMLSEGE